MTPISIVVPVHNKAALTGQFLDRLLAQQETRCCEIIVVDDASTDDTPRILAGYSPRVTAVRNNKNLGFAGASNRGIDRASSEMIILVNNDIAPIPGWLDALARETAEHPQAAVIGAKLMFPNDTIQHAGVVFAGDGNPYHLYSGFPAAHPAVNRSRPFQAVTAACIALRRGIFREAGGFDESYKNGHEDVDLCLRLGEAGYEIRYCHRAAAYHLESASRDRNSPAARDNGRLYRSRWAGRVVPDDLNYYLSDGLIDADYSCGYPLRLEISPMLGAFQRTGGSAELERLLQERSAQTAELLQETSRLALLLAEMAPEAQHPDIVARAAPASSPQAEVARGSGVGGHQAALKQDLELEDALCRLQKVLGARLAGFEPSRWLGYRRMVRDLRALICRSTPEGSTVAVVSRGDSQLLELPARQGEHLPQDSSGGYCGFHPASDEDAIEALESLRSKGAGYLAVPATACWWLDHYPDFAAYLHQIGWPLDGHPEVGLVFSLSGGSPQQSGRREEQAAH
ncbi:MAG: glycosyltransferase family 2 protein [Actinomycetota bacterium]